MSSLELPIPQPKTSSCKVINSSVDLLPLFNDGRVFGIHVEYRLASELNMTRMGNGHLYDLHDPATDEKHEVRVMTKLLSFAPSNQRGKGRKFNEAEFLDKLDKITGYIVVDGSLVDPEGNFNFVFVRSDYVRTLYSQGILGKNAQLTANKAKKMLFGIETPRRQRKTRKKHPS